MTLAMRVSSLIVQMVGGLSSAFPPAATHPLSVEYLEGKRNISIRQYASMDLEEARIGIRLVREAIETAVNSGERLDTPKDLPAIFDELGGVFVTLHSGTLRGCVGYPYATLRIKDALIDSAISAAMYDYRFPPVRADEFAKITVEITFLTKPTRIGEPNDIVIGKHGVIVKKGSRQGLLLPQVATEFDWTQQEFLDQTFLKAGLRPRQNDVEVLVFEGQIFSELRPAGEVIERSLE